MLAFWYQNAIIKIAKQNRKKVNIITEETKTITVRIPIDLYDQAKEVFDSNYVSVNTGINLALNAIASQKTLIVAQNKDQNNHD